MLPKFEPNLPDMDFSQRCVILVPVASHIEPACEASLDALERAGLPVWRRWGYSDISRGRSEMATEALAEGFEELLWIDADTEFQPDAVSRLRSHNLPIVGAIYPVKNERRLACNPLQTPDEITFGEGGGLKELQFLATGFLLTQRKVYAKMREHFKMPTCVGGKHGLVPYFQPMIHQDQATGRQLYLSEGFSFCERAKQCGFKIFADTTIRLGHIGKKSFSWEDAGTDIVRYQSYRFSIGPST